MALSDMIWKKSIVPPPAWKAIRIFGIRYLSVSAPFSRLTDCEKYYKDRNGSLNFGWAKLTEIDKNRNALSNALIIRADWVYWARIYTWGS